MPKTPPKEEDDGPRLSKARLQGIMKKVDPKMRTRKAAQIEKMLEGDPDALAQLEEATKATRPPGKVKNPPSSSDDISTERGKIWNGNRPGFNPRLEDAFWKDKKNLTCAICGESIDLNGQGGDAPSIDHKTDWATLKNTLDTIDVCNGKAHWRLVLQTTATGAYNDLSNLRPAHQGCNSSKSGSKSTDAAKPEYLGICPGTSICDLKYEAD